MLEKLGALEIREKAPELPGLYAWYLDLRPANGEDLTNGDWLGVFEKIVSWSRPPDVDARLDSHFGICWKGELQVEANRPSELLSSFLGDVGTDGFRNEFEELMDAVGSAFSAPLYVGQAKRNLKIRLLQHYRVLFERADTEDARVREFAERVNARGISPLQLRIECFPIPKTSNRKAIIQLAETLFNRSAYPVLGRK